jgi:hypothetical protein
MGHSVANARACHKKSSTSTRVAISAKTGIGASSNKDAFRLS